MQRYATRVNCVEINSSFYRPHNCATYQRRAGSVPADFRFSAKLPRAITHERRLVACEPLIAEFIGQAQGLGPRLGCLLVQLPPSLMFNATEAQATSWTGLVHRRLHGSPRMYYSAYASTLIEALALRVQRALVEGHTVWCVFDNTASGVATEDALALSKALLSLNPTRST